MPAESELWDLVASRREGVLATIRRDGLPQLTNVLYLPGPGGRTARISTTADRLKTRTLARDPRAVLHVSGDNFWAYAVAEGHAALTPAAARPGDEACRQLLEVHSAFYGPQDKDAFFAEMIARRRLVIRLSLDRVYGVIASGGRRPVPVHEGAPRLPGQPRHEQQMFMPFRTDRGAPRPHPRLARGGRSDAAACRERGEQFSLRAVALGGHPSLLRKDHLS